MRRDPWANFWLCSKCNVHRLVDPLLTCFVSPFPRQIFPCTRLHQALLLVRLLILRACCMRELKEAVVCRERVCALNATLMMINTPTLSTHNNSLRGIDLSGRDRDRPPTSPSQGLIMCMPVWVSPCSIMIMIPMLEDRAWGIRFQES